jgi:hypothetical protein
MPRTVSAPRTAKNEMDALERMIRDGKTEVRTALLERIARSPLDQFNQLKAIPLPSLR